MLRPTEANLFGVGMRMQEKEEELNAERNRKHQVGLICLGLVNYSEMDMAARELMQKLEMSPPA